MIAEDSNICHQGYYYGGFPAPTTTTDDRCMAAAIGIDPNASRQCY